VRLTQPSIQVWRALGVPPSGRAWAACFLRRTRKSWRLWSFSVFVRESNLRERLRGLSPYVHLDRTKIRKMHPRTQNTKKIISAISGLVVRFELSARSEIDVKSGRTRKSGDIHQEFVRTVPRRKSPRNSQLCVLCASAVNPVLPCLKIYGFLINRSGFSPELFHTLWKEPRRNTDAKRSKRHGARRSRAV
jgi:hypothetical protein